jgi:hypothetical protein
MDDAACLRVEQRDKGLAHAAWTQGVNVENRPQAAVTKTDPRVVDDGVERRWIVVECVRHRARRSGDRIVACDVELEQRDALFPSRVRADEPFDRAMTALGAARSEQDERVVVLLEDSRYDRQTNALVSTCDEYSSHGILLVAALASMAHVSTTQRTQAFALRPPLVRSLDRCPRGTSRGA